LHELAAAKTSLAYDIQELVRWLVDLSVLQILEEKNLKKLDFIVTENYQLRLKPRRDSLVPADRYYAVIAFYSVLICLSLAGMGRLVRRKWDGAYLASASLVISSLAPSPALAIRCLY